MGTKEYGKRLKRIFSQGETWRVVVICLGGIEMWPENWFWKELKVQEKLFDIGWSDESECQRLVPKKKIQKGTGCTTVAEWHDIRRNIPQVFRKWEQKRRLRRKSGTGKGGIVDASSRVYKANA